MKIIVHPRDTTVDITPFSYITSSSTSGNNHSHNGSKNMSNLSTLLPKSAPILSPNSLSPMNTSSNSSSDTNNTNNDISAQNNDHDIMMADDDSSLRRRRISPAQLAVLRRVYNERTKYPVVALRNELAEKLGLRPRMVQVWFQNQRQQEATKRREQERDRDRRMFEREHARMHHYNINANHAASRFPLPHATAAYVRPVPHHPMALAPNVVSPNTAMPMSMERVISTPTEQGITHCDGSRHPPPLVRTSDGRILRGFPISAGIVSSELFRPWSYECPPSWRNSEPPTAKNSRRRRRVTVSGGDMPMIPMQQPLMGTQIMRTRTAERPMTTEDMPLSGMMSSNLAQRPRRSSGPVRPPWMMEHLSGDVRVSALAASMALPSSPMSRTSFSATSAYPSSHISPLPPLSANSSMSDGRSGYTAGAAGAAGASHPPRYESSFEGVTCTDPYCRTCPPLASPYSPVSYSYQQRQRHPSSCQNPCCVSPRYTRVSAHPSPPYSVPPPPSFRTQPPLPPPAAAAMRGYPPATTGAPNSAANASPYPRHQQQQQSQHSIPTSSSYNTRMMMESANNGHGCNPMPPITNPSSRHPVSSATTTATPASNSTMNNNHHHHHHGQTCTCCDHRYPMDGVTAAY